MLFFKGGVIKKTTLAGKEVDKKRRSKVGGERN
jgi:hypothetical protein